MAWKWKLAPPPGLNCRYSEAALPPVDVLDLEGGYFLGTQSEIKKT
jgi:hypothetical protein